MDENVRTLTEALESAGRGYLVVGLSYGALPDGGAGGISGATDSRLAMVGFIEKVRALVDRIYGVDQRRVFLTGLSTPGAYPGWPYAANFGTSFVVQFQRLA